MNSNESERSARIRESFNSYRPGREDILSRLYHPDIHFKDALHECHGLSDLTRYYQGIYKNVSEIRFEFSAEAVSDTRHLAVWKMYLKTPKLNRGREIELAGVSEIVFDDQTNLVIFHQDYYDAGAMLYEHLPIVGSIIRAIKKSTR